MPLVYIPTLPEDDDTDVNVEQGELSGSRWSPSNTKVAIVVLSVVALVAFSVTLFLTCS